MSCCKIRVTVIPIKQGGYAATHFSVCSVTMNLRWMSRTTNRLQFWYVPAGVFCYRHHLINNALDLLKIANVTLFNCALCAKSQLKNTKPFSLQTIYYMQSYYYLKHVTLIQANKQVDRLPRNTSQTTIQTYQAKCSATTLQSFQRLIFIINWFNHKLSGREFSVVTTWK